MATGSTRLRRPVHLLRLFLRETAGPNRTPGRNRRLATLLALTAGMLNSVGFISVGMYTSHMTGITATVADQVVLGNLRLLGMGLLAIATFVFGAMVCAVVFNWARRRRLSSRFAIILVLEALLVLSFGALADLLRWEHRAWVFLPVLCFTMGLQNAIITKISAAQIRTTHVTGMVTDIGIELGKWLYRPRRRDLDPVIADRDKLALLVLLVGVFFVGGVVGVLGFRWIGFRTMVVPALVLLVAAWWPVWSDLQARSPGAPPPT